MCWPGVFFSGSSVSPNFFWQGKLREWSQLDLLYLDGNLGRQLLDFVLFLSELFTDRFCGILTIFQGSPQPIPLNCGYRLDSLEELEDWDEANMSSAACISKHFKH